MEAARILEPRSSRSPLRAARLARKLTVEEAARRAGLTADQVEWLEDGRVYRFPSSEHALTAVLLYATALDIDRREARALAGLPVPPKPLERNPLPRLAAAGAAAGAVLALAALVLVPGWIGGGATAPTARAPLPELPPPWRISVDVLNGGGDVNYTRRIADRIGAFGYHIVRVRRANRFDYPQTAVYYEPGGKTIAARLAGQLGVETKPLPGGNNPRRLVVIVGEPRISAN